MNRVPETALDFPQFQLAEPILVGLLRILKRDLAKACAMSLVASEAESVLGKVAFRDILVAAANPIKEEFPRAIVRYLRTEFQPPTSGKRLVGAHFFEISCAVANEDPNCVTALLLRLLRGVYATIERAEISDLWLLENPQGGIDLTKICQGITVAEEGELSAASAIVRRGKVTYQFSAQELDARQLLKPEEILARVTCRQ